MEKIEKYERFFEDCATTVLSIGTGATIGIAPQAPTPAAKATTIAIGTATTVIATSGVRLAGDIVTDSMKKTSKALSDNRAPSPSDFTEIKENSIGEIFYFIKEKIYLFQEQFMVNINILLEGKTPQEQLLIHSLMLLGFALFFLLAIIINKKGRIFTNYLESKTKSKIIKMILNVNKKYNDVFLIYYYFMAIISLMVSLLCMIVYIIFG